jgi:hypothetical protein
MIAGVVVTDSAMATALVRRGPSSRIAGRIEDSQ